MSRINSENRIFLVRINGKCVPLLSAELYAVFCQYFQPSDEIIFYVDDAALWVLCQHKDEFHLTSRIIFLQVPNAQRQTFRQRTKLKNITTQPQRRINELILTKKEEHRLVINRGFHKLKDILQYYQTCLISCYFELI